MNYNPIDTPNENYYRNLYYKETKKRSLRRTLASVCIMLVSAYILVYAFATVYYTVLGAVLAVCTPNDMTLSVIEKLSEILIYIVQLVFPALVYMLLCGKSLRDCFVLPECTTQEKVSPVRLLCFAACAFAISSAMSGISAVFTSIFGLSETAFDTPAPANSIEFLLGILSVAVLPAIIEEAVFRGLILGRLLPYGKGFAICAGAVFFASVHGSAEQMIYSFVYGVLFGFIAVKTGSVKTGIIIHFLNNLYACCMEYAETLLKPELYELLSGIIYTAFIAAGLLSAVYLIGKNIVSIPAEKPKEAAGELTAYETYRSLVSPLMIVYYIFVLFETLVVYFGS